MAAVLEGLSWNLARRIGDEKRPQWLHETLSGSQKSQHLCCPLLVRTPAACLHCAAMPAGMCSEGLQLARSRRLGLAAWDTAPPRAWLASWSVDALAFGGRFTFRRPNMPSVA